MINIYKPFLQSLQKINPILLIAAIFLNSNVFAQSIAPLEPVSEHYKALQALDPASDSNNYALDTIQFPMEGRTTGRQFIDLEPSYLKHSDYDILKDLVTFPANSSPQTRAELDYLLGWQTKRSKTDVSRAYEIAYIGYWPPLDKDGEYGDLKDLFWECKSLVGKSCDPRAYPHTAKLLAGIMRDIRIAEFTLKYHFKRARPYHLEPKLNPLGRVSNPSFASGHTLWAYTQAFTWAELMPNLRSKYLDLAYEVGVSREIMGIHYPSDEEAARVISHKMLELMFENPQFKTDFERAKEEWK